MNSSELEESDGELHEQDKIENEGEVSSRQNKVESEESEREMSSLQGESGDVISNDSGETEIERTIGLDRGDAVNLGHWG